MYSYARAKNDLVRCIMLALFTVLLLLCIPAAARAAGAEDEEDEELKPDMSIPVVYINIDESQGSIQDMLDSDDHSVYCYGTVSIEVPEGFHYCDFPDLACESVTDLAMSIRGRGNSTWDTQKRPFKIKLDKKTDLFGLGKNKHWVLVANAYDDTLIKDRISGWLGDWMSFEFTPRGVPVDLIMTGDQYGSHFLGSYYLSENVRVDTNRLEIDELTVDDTELPAITGGYLLQDALQTDKSSPDVFYTSRGVDWATHTPSFDTSENGNLSADNKQDSEEASSEKLFAGPELGDGYENHAQQEYIQNHIQKIEDAIFADDGTYRDLMDVKSTAMYWLVDQASQNGDGYATGSTYIYKKRDKDGVTGKLYWGPLWDFDYAWGGGRSIEGFTTGHDWLKPIFHDKAKGGFIEEVQKQWPLMKAGLLKLTEEGGIIDQYYEETRNSAELNARIYDLTISYREKIDRLKDWINRRTNWMDAHISEVKDLVFKVEFIADGSVYKTEYMLTTDTLTGKEEYPEKEGYVFLGWYDEDGNLIDSEQNILRDMKLTARYIPDAEATHAQDIALRRENAVIRMSYYSKYYQMFYTVIPTDAQDKVVAWTSSDESLATVDRDGKVSYNDLGTVTLTGRLKSGAVRQFTLTIIGSFDDGVFPDSIQPEEDVIRMTVGDQSAIMIKTTPSPAEIGSFYYHSDDESIVTVDSNGALTAVGPGQTKVHVSTRTEAAGGHDLVALETEATVIVSLPDSDRISISKAVVSSVPTKVYTGSPIKPGVTVKLGGRTLKKGTDYKLTYTSNTNPGMGKIKITGINQYKGSKTVTFKIIPRPTRIKTVTPLKNGFKVTWCRREKQITGYSVKWSTSSSMKDAKYNTIRNTQTVSLKKTNLKPGKTYYIQVRTYKEVNGVKYYSRWSAKEKVTTKR